MPTPSGQPARLVRRNQVGGALTTAIPDTTVGRQVGLVGTPRPRSPETRSSSPTTLGGRLGRVEIEGKGPPVAGPFLDLGGRYQCRFTNPTAVAVAVSNTVGSSPLRSHFLVASRCTKPFVDGDVEVTHEVAASCSSPSGCPGPACLAAQDGINVASGDQG